MHRASSGAEGGNGGGAIPARLRLARWTLRHWPLPRGAHRAEALLLRGFRRWPERGDVDFAFGRLLDASLAEWPRGMRELWLHGVMEPAELAVWRALLRPGDAVVDGGANWGYWSLAAARLAAPGGRVLAVEPVPATAAALRRNLEASGCTAVQVVEAALAAEPGTVELSVFDDDPCGVAASVGRPEGWRPAGSVAVPALRLDDLLAERGMRPALVKLDVEGSELAALRGAPATVRGEAAPVVAFEWNVQTARAAGYHPRETLALLRGAGYAPYVAGRAALEPFAVPADDGAEWTPMVWCLPPAGPARARLAALLRRGGRG